MEQESRGYKKRCFANLGWIRALPLRFGLPEPARKSHVMPSQRERSEFCFRLQESMTDVLVGLLLSRDEPLVVVFACAPKPRLQDTAFSRSGSTSHTPQPFASLSSESRALDRRTNSHMRRGETLRSPACRSSRRVANKGSPPPKDATSCKLRLLDCLCCVKGRCGTEHRTPLPSFLLLCTLAAAVLQANVDAVMLAIVNIVESSRLELQLRFIFFEILVCQAGRRKAPNTSSTVCEALSLRLCPGKERIRENYETLVLALDFAPFNSVE